jgi:hypothetical protein
MSYENCKGRTYDTARSQLESPPWYSRSNTSSVYASHITFYVS